MHLPCCLRRRNWAALPPNQRTGRLRGGPQADFSAAEDPHLFTLPPARQVTEAFAARGVSDGVHVVLYSRKSMQNSTRFWWMLRWLGFDDASVLDGGLDKWLAERRPISAEPCTYPPGELSLDPRPDLFVDKQDVLAAINDTSVCIVNALEPDVHRGENLRYGRRGRIPNSVNVPSSALLDPETLEMVGLETVRKAFAHIGARTEQRVITYCGGGIKATLNAFLLHRSGFPNIAVYDGSMSEWSADPTLPMETDPSFR